MPVHLKARSGMKSLVRRLSSISLLWQILIPNLLCVALGIAAIQYWTVQQTRSMLQDDLKASLNGNIAILQSDVERLGKGWRLDGSRLSIGEVVLNDRNDIVDRVASIAGGVATIFAGEIRVATTIRKDDGSRAAGTKLAPGPARSATLERGETYRGTATILGKDYVTIYQPVKDASGGVAGLLFVGVPTAPTEAALAASVEEALAASVIVLGVLGLIVGFLLRRALSPLVAMTHAMQQLATGDLTIVVPAMHRKDQIGRMAAALDVFKKQAAENARLAREQEEQREHAAKDKHAALVAMADRIESEVAGSVEAVSRETELMAATTDRLAASADQAGKDAQSASGAANEALTNTQTVAAAAEELSASIREIGSQVGRSTEIVSRAVHTGQAAQETISALTSRVAQIGAVAGMISDIAAKTNLLALNATIEAARAGEAGKGFAVVASEVKTLATQTARSTEEISRHIGEVSAATEETVRAVGQIEAAITEMNQVATAIAAAVEQQGAATEEISRSVSMTKDAARAVATRVTSLASGAVQSGAQAEDVHKNLRELANAVVELKHVVVRIVRTSTAEVDRRHDTRVTLDLPARISLAGSTTAHAVRVKDLSEHGAHISGGPAAQPGVRGSLTIEGIGTAIPFLVHQAAEEERDGYALHLGFEANAEMVRAIDSVLQRHGQKPAKAA
jgi:methyl-accepting chemotaxis protein